ncbi:MAG: GDYXXLXY domain-containing protein [Bacteroidota bacterium]
MLNKKTILILFILLALVQLYVPAKMILSREEVIASGSEYKFKTAPVDPYDPFRGRYIILNFQEINVPVADLSDWKEGDDVYAVLGTDEEGFAIFTEALKSPPDADQDYLATQVEYIVENEEKGLLLILPFNRYYMEEFKAPAAEQAYREAGNSTGRKAYALVMIKEGEAVLKDVLIDGVPIREYVENAIDDQP